MRSLAVAIAIVVLAPLAAEAQSLVGAWTLERTDVAGGENPGTFLRQPGLLIFTDDYYSWVQVRGNAPRPALSEDSTDAERLAAFEMFVGNAGTYTLDGSTIIRQAIAVKEPYLMGMTETFELQFEGESRFVWTFNPFAAPELTVTQTWVRAQTP